MTGRWLAALVLALTVVRWAMAAAVPLAPDETYYWVWSQALAPGYLDHPPMVAVWIRAGTWLAGDNAFGVRLFGPLSAAVASWCLYDAAQRLFADWPTREVAPGAATAWGVIARGVTPVGSTARGVTARGARAREATARGATARGTTAGAAAVLLLNGTLFLGVGTVIMTPDSPLLFFWTATLWAAVRLIDSGAGGWWLVAGGLGGLALDSKYTALLLWAGLGLWVLLIPAMRPWLRRWQPWAGMALGLLLFSPVILWNGAHGWAGFVRQGGRVGDWQPARAAGFLAELVGGQVGLATPWIWLLCMIGLVAAVRRSWVWREPRWSLLAALSLPAVLVFIQHAVGDRVQGNWPAILYPALVLAAAGLVGPLVGPGRNRAWIGASALGFGITAVVYLQAATGVVPLPLRFDPIAAKLSGWDILAARVEAERQRAGANFVVADGYATTSELAWWLPRGVPVVGLDQHWALTDLPAARIAGVSGLLLRDARRTDPPDVSIWALSEPLGPLVRPGSPPFAMYRVVASDGARAAVELPRRR